MTRVIIVMPVHHHFFLRRFFAENICVLDKYDFVRAKNRIHKNYENKCGTAERKILYFMFLYKMNRTDGRQKAKKRTNQINSDDNNGFQLNFVIQFSIRRAAMW